jgi:hypothetical protein
MSYPRFLWQLNQSFSQWGHHWHYLWIVYIGKVCKWNRQQQRHETVLPLATLGIATQMGSFLFMALHPRWLRQVSSDCHLCQHYRGNFHQWKQSFVVCTFYFFSFRSYSLYILEITFSQPNVTYFWKLMKQLVGELVFDEVACWQNDLAPPSQIIISGLVSFRERGQKLNPRISNRKVWWPCEEVEAAPLGGIRRRWVFNSRHALKQKNVACFLIKPVACPIKVLRS